MSIIINLPFGITLTIGAKTKRNVIKSICPLAQKRDVMIKHTIVPERNVIKSITKL